MSDDKTIGQKCYQLYLMSKKNLEGDNPDLADEVIVALWQSLDGLQNENNALQKLVGEQQQRLAKYYHQNEILSTRLAKATGDKSLNVGELDSATES
jgi:hypothetical protein